MPRYRSNPRRLLHTIACVMLCAGALHAATFRVTDVTPLTSKANDPLFMPTDVTIGTNGDVFVADGTNGRIVVFDPQGKQTREILSTADMPLANPIGLDFSRDGLLWIADNGTQRLLAVDMQGDKRHDFSLPELTGQSEVDVTDVAADAGGVWFVDNDAHRIYRQSLGGEPLQTFGSRRGEGLGEFQYPFMIAMTERGRAVVTDVINGRVQALSREGIAPRRIGRYGVEPGQFHRPKGIAVDEAGRIWVTDGSLGTVQAFTDDGEFLGYLENAGGSVLQLSTPGGVATGGSGIVYVCEIGTSRILKIEFDEEAGIARSTTGSRTGQHPPSCTVCHLEWVPPVDSGRASGLSAVPPASREEPFVSRSESCLSCHDGSVVDSRHDVWRAHGHKRGVEPPPSMNVPDALPLVSGAISCRTCHSAHSHGGAGHGLKDSIFLRVEHKPTELCVSCHADTAAAALSHPIEATDSHSVIVPGSGSAEDDKPFKAHGDDMHATHVALDDNGCLSCHAGHGNEDERLLRSGRTGESSCVGCHPDMPADSFHPIDSIRPVESLQTAGRDIISKIADGSERPNDTSIVRKLLPEDSCLACHKMHESKEPKYLLAQDRRDGTLCLSCHESVSPLLNSRHDLRVSASEFENAHGETASLGGPCSACHAVHSGVRPGAVAAADLEGACTDCHQPTGCAGSLPGTTFDHPSDLTGAFQLPASSRTMLTDLGRADDRLTCLACHSPHASEHGALLRTSQDELCGSCHTEYVVTLAGVHDFQQNPMPMIEDARPASASRCGSCHSMHSANGAALWSGTTARADDAAALCLNCHQNNGPAGAAMPNRHPCCGVSGQQTSSLPYFDGHGNRSDSGEISCATCHNAHAHSGSNPALLRKPDGEPAAALCYSCHTHVTNMGNSLHADTLLDAGRIVDTPCAPCHAVHSLELAAPAMWVGPFSTAPANSASGGPVETTVDRMCTGCHSKAGGMSDVAVVAHSPVPAVHARNLERTMGVSGGGDEPTGLTHFSCVTCHLPHGRHGINVGAFDKENLAWLRASAPMLRPYRKSIACSDCHGMEGLQLYLNFHRLAE